MVRARRGSDVLMPEELPVLPLMSTVIFPLGISTIQVWYKRNLRLLQARAKRGDIIGFAFARTADMDQLTPGQLSAGGTAAKIIKIEGFGEGGKQITVQGLKRIRVKEFAQTEPYLVAKVEYLEEIRGDPEGERREANKIMEMVKRLVELDPAYPAELYHICSMNADTPGKLADMIASAFHFDLSAKQAILEELDVRSRLVRLVELLEMEIGKAELSKNVTFDARRDLEKKIKERVLREEMKTIKEELGDVGLHEKEVAELRNKIKESSLPPYAEKQALLEVERLRLISIASAEYGMVRTHIDWLVSIPWKKESCRDVDIENLEATLTREHFGQKKVKENILQLFSIRKLRRDLKGIVLCFVGPAGTGKTSLARAIAKGLGRKFVRVSVAGVRDEAVIKGKRSTYAEAFPGKILNAIKESGCANPLMMIEQVGRMGTENLRGDPAAALAEAL
jgi:ATP-dependent Lon protease